jgi:hypothetical protein
MSIHVLLTALEEYLEVRRDVSSGCNDEDALLGAKKRFAKALNEYIDWRTDGVLEDRKRRISTERSVQLADLLTSNIDDVSSIAALNSAPKPPDERLVADKEILDRWFKAYQDWYNTSRKKGISSP